MNFFKGLIKGGSARPTSPEGDGNLDDLAVNHLRRLYSAYKRNYNPHNAKDNCEDLFIILPVFYNAFNKADQTEIAARFPELFEFAKDVSAVFVVTIVDLARGGSAEATALTILYYFDVVDKPDKPAVGWNFLKTLHILSGGSSELIKALMKHNLCSVIVRILKVFLDLPPPKPAAANVAVEYTPRGKRVTLQKLLSSILNRLLKHTACSEDLIVKGDIKYVFSAISSPCPMHNKIWRKSNSDLLVQLCRHSLSNEVINFIHSQGCTQTCIRRISDSVRRVTPLESVEMLVALFCLLKDSSEISQVILGDFASGGGYKFIYDYLLFLEGKSDEEAKEALRNVVLLVQSLTMCGFLDLAPSLTDGGPFQDEEFEVPVPTGNGMSVKNIDAFSVLQNSFLKSSTTHLGLTIVDIILNIYSSDPANYFILDSLHTLPLFIEALPHKDTVVQERVFKLLEYVVCTLNYVPTAEYASLCLVLQNKVNMITQAHALNLLIKFVSFSAKHKNIFREVGLLSILTNCLQMLWKELSDAAKGNSRKYETQLSQPYEETLSSSSHSDSDSGSKEATDAEYSILLMECLRVLIEDNVANGMLFKESDGVKILLKLISFTQSRQMALKLMIQLILLEGGSEYMYQLLTHINTLPPVAVGAKIDILKMLLRCFQLDSRTKNTFREVSGFGVLISVLASLYGSLLDNRKPPWSKVSRNNVLALVRLVFTMLSDAMEDNPANRRHFDNNIKFESFSDPLRSLGCFCSDMKTIMPHMPKFQHPKYSSTNVHKSESLAWFNAEFKLFDPPSSKLSKSSSLHAAAEIFRFLRDMSLGIPDTDSEPLILDSCVEILSPSYLGKYLAHPGATICMVDLLPAVHWTSYRVVKSCDISNDATVEMTDTEVEIRNWCEYLQGRVVAELYMLASGNRNQQCMCQVGLPGRLLLRCKEALANENHALHHPLQRTFERLSCQALTPADFRNFLRLGDPLNCKLDELQSLNCVTSQNNDKVDAIMESKESGVENTLKSELCILENKHCFGSKLSVAKIQSLVSMASLRRGGLGGTRDCPPFVEFDMSIGGFAYLFFPSVFPCINSSQSTTSIIYSNAEKGFPPVNGLSFSAWLCIERCNLSEDNDPIISLLSLFATYKLPSRKRHSFTCIEIFLCPKDKTLVVSTQQHKFRSRLGSQGEENGFVRKRERNKDAVYECPVLFDEGRWHHVAVVLQKIVLRGCMASLYLDGTLVKSQKLSYISPFNVSSNDPDSQAMIHGLIGTPATRRSIAPIVFQLGPTHLIAEPLSSVHIQQMYALGPNYVGSFQAISLNEGPVDTVMDQSRPMEPLLAEEKIVFGLLASQAKVVSMKELSHTVSAQEYRAISKEVSVSVDDEVTPLTILSNTALHLGGPPRTGGAVMIGHSGIRTFVPQPLRALLSSVGGTSVMLGLVAMANTVECLYASVKALDCTVGGNPSALKEMEQTGGFQILGMLFRSKSHLLNSHILHLSFSLVGSQDSQCMLATIPNPVAFRDLLADLSIWSHTSEDLQKMLFDHFCDLLCHSSYASNRKHMLDMNLVPLILHRLTDHKLDKTTICKMGNVLVELLKNIPKKSDLKRLGHLLVTTLPDDYSVDENRVFIYHFSPPVSPVDRNNHRRGSHSNWGYPEGIEASKGVDKQELKKIRLRNMLLELLNSLLTDDKLEFDPKVAHAIHSVLGFDWLLLFLHPHIHRETVNRAFRILVQLLSEPHLLNKFREGSLGCKWLKEAQGYLFELVPQMNQHFHLKFHSILSPGKEQGWKELKAFCSLPGFCLLNNLLPKHKESPQVYLLVIALLLGKSVFDVPNNAPFDLESLDSIFQMSSMEHKVKVNLCMDAVYILLTITKVLLHPEIHSEFGDDAALVIIKFLERVYRDVPQFAKMAAQPELVESLVATLFPPIAVKTTVDEASEAAAANANANVRTPEEDEGFLVIPLTNTLTESEQPSTLLQSNNPTVVSVIKLIRTILIDGLATTSIKPPVISCPIVDQVLDAYPSLTSMIQQKQYQTVVINSAMEYLKNGSEDIVLLFKDRSTMDKSLAGVGVFCSRIVDRIWQGCYLDPAGNMFDFLFHLLGQAKDKSQIVPLGEIQKALHRLILYQLSPIKLTNADCIALVDILCSLTTKLDDILDSLNNDEEFLACLFYCLYRLTEECSQENYSQSPGANSFIGYVPASWIQMKMAANRVFCKMLDLKRKSMEEIFHVQFNARSGSVSSDHEDDQMSGITGISGGAMRNYSKLQHCKEFMTDALAKRYEAYISLENSNKERITAITPQRKSFALFGGRRSAKETGGRSRNLLVLAQEYVEYHTQSFIKAVHQLDALLLRKYQRNQEYKLRFTASEWARTADELTRERGLWGPLNPCYLDKWMLDSVEGPMRMRKRLCYNDKFYSHYPFKDDSQLAKHYDHLDYATFLTHRKFMMPHSLMLSEGYHHAASYFSQKHKPPCSVDSELYRKLVVQLKRSPIVSPLRLVCSPHGSTSSSHHDNDDNELYLSVEYGAENSTPGTSITDIETVSSEEVDLVSSLEAGNPVSLALSRMLEPEDRIQMKIQCARLEGLDSKEGLLLLGTTHFYVVEGLTLTKNGEIADLENLTINEYDPVVPMELAQYSSENSQDIVMPPIKCMKWHYDTIQEVHKRRYLLRECALEVFNDDGRSHFLIFEISKKNKVYNKLTNLAKSMLSDTSEDLKAGVKHDADLEASAGIFSSFNREKTITQKWEETFKNLQEPLNVVYEPSKFCFMALAIDIIDRRGPSYKVRHHLQPKKTKDGEITNFQYLMHLNTLAGRSYNDLMQYPIFPWILADYTSEVLDLTNPATFRDLTKPMGAQSEGRLSGFLERYQHLEDPGPTGEGCHKYLYGTHYSSAMIVASYLIRMEPFTQFFLKLQGGNFDIPDRLFHCIHEAWRSASEVNMADVKELIPEFFYLPDFLTNDNRFILGMKQNGETLNNIVLPPWAKGDPKEFIRMHREALECDHVSAHLHEWIDLIFGYKQQGQPSLEANNLFHPLFYEGAVNLDKLTDPVKRKATVGFINNFGQMPKQIFKRPHRQRKVKLAEANEASSSSVSTEHSKLFYKSVLGTLKEPIKEFRGKVGQIVSTGDRYLAAVEENKVLLPPLYNRYFAWGFPDCSAKIGTLEQDKTISVFEGLHQGHIRCAAAVNEYTLLTAGDVPVVCVWLMKTTGTKEKAPTQLTLKKTLHGHSAPVSCLSCSSSYNLIVSGSQDCTCILWDLSKLVFLRQLQCPNGPITAICINELTGDIVTCAKQYLYVWSINGHLLASTRISSSSHVSINCCIMSELISWDKNNVIVIGSSDGIVRMYKVGLVKKKHSKTSMSPSADISSRQFSADSQVIASQIDDVFVAQLSTISVEEETAENHNASTSNSETRLSTEDQQDEVLWHRKLMLNIKLTLHTSFTRDDNTAPAEITAFCISKDHKKLFVGDSRGRIYAWSSVETTGRMADHWIKDEVADRCSKCQIPFSFTERKHHCRDCGNIFCSKCSAYESVVLRIQVKKRVRVCEDCYNKNQEMYTL